VPEPVENLLKLQEARIKLGRAGARTVELRGDRLTAAPITLDSAQSKALRAEIGDVVYESLKRTLRVRLPEDAAERFRAVLRAADALLAIKSELAEAA
jgi:transcription-repair coupling factor (superfamily II helicase)